jgi:DNA replication protein DnaC
MGPTFGDRSEEKRSAGTNVQFVTAATLVATLAKVHADSALESPLTILGRPKPLIIYELGYLPSEPDWGGVFGDPVVATAILDRLLHHSTDRLQERTIRPSAENRLVGLSPRPTSVRETLRATRARP